MKRSEATSEPPKVVRPPSVFNILTSKCASGHNGVHFFDISTSKSGRNPCVFNILTSKCASRHNGVHFFDISTAKSGPRMVCFVHFDFEMYFAPQRRALFPKVVRTPRVLYILTWKCTSRHNGVHFFDISTAKSGPTFCTFSTSQLPKVVRTPSVLYILTWKCALRHNGVHFSTSQLVKVVRSWCVLCILTCKCASRHNSAPAYFSTLRSHKSLEKHNVSRLSHLFTHLHLLSSDSFSSTLLSSNLSLLSASSLLCFSSVHIVGSLTSKLPSNTTP